MSRWGLCLSGAALVASVAALCAGCDRVSIERLGAVGEVDRDEPIAMAIHLRKRYFDTLGQTEATREATRFGWAGGEVALDRTDGTRISLSELSTTFEPASLELQPDGDQLVLRIRYQPPISETRTVRFVDSGGNLGLCRIELGLGERMLEVEFDPIAEDGRPTLSPRLVDGLSSETVFAWSPAEPCGEDLDAIDWPSLSQQVDALLETAATEVLVPELLLWLDTELSLPGGGVRARARRTWAFDPVTLDLLFRTPADPPLRDGFTPSGDGFVIGLVPGFRQVLDAKCVEGLALELPDPVGLTQLDAPDTTPSGEPYAAAVAIDRVYLETALAQLVGAGHACADVRTNAVGALPPLDLFVPGIDQVNRSTGFNFGDEGQVRLQPLGPLGFEVIGEKSARWIFERARLEVYAESDDVFVRVAEVVGKFTIETELSINSLGALVVDVATVEVEVEDQDLSLLQRVGLAPDPELLASSALESLVERLVQIPLPRPFGLSLELEAFGVDERAISIFVDLF